MIFNHNIPLSYVKNKVEKITSMKHEQDPICAPGHRCKILSKGVRFMPKGVKFVSVGVKFVSKGVNFM